MKRKTKKSSTMVRQQLGLLFPKRGGKRERSGRKPSGPRARLRHAPRPQFSGRMPHHVTWKMEPRVGNLRRGERFAEIERALRAIKERDDFRVVHFSVQHDHVHLIVEASERKSFFDGMRALGIRIARGLNRALSAKGRVFFE